MADLEGHWLLRATILSVGEILGSGSLFLEILGCSSDFSSATKSSSYGADLGGFASLQQSKGLLGTSAV